MNASSATVESPVAFDLLKVDDDFRRNPYPAYRTLRDHAPLCVNSDGTYVVTRWSDVSSVLVSSDTSTDKSAELKKSMGEGPILEFQLTAMTCWDPPRHGRIRGALAHVFTPRAMARWVPMVEQAVDDLVQEAETRGTIDLVTDFAAVLPLTLICRMLGVAKAEKERFRAWANSITSSLDPVVPPGVIDTANVHAEEWKAFFSDLIEQRRREPGDDIISLS